MQNLNTKKILGAVYHILKKYHGATGLRVYAETDLLKPSISYFTFYIPAYSDLVRTTIPNDYSLTVYQSHIGLPAFATGGYELAHPEQDKVELDIEASIVPYFLNRLEIERYLLSQRKQIMAFRKSRYFNMANRYLAAIFLLWKFAASFGEVPSIQMAEEEEEVSSPELSLIDVYKCNELYFSADCKVTVGLNAVLDLYPEEGAPPAEEELYAKFVSLLKSRAAN